MQTNETPRDFSDFITDLRHGNCHQELSEGLNLLTEAVAKHGKVGTLTLTIKVKPEGSSQVLITDAIKVSKPEATKQPTFMFVTPGNNLEREGVTRQIRIEEMKEVVPGAKITQLKEVNAK